MTLNPKTGELLTASIRQQLATKPAGGSNPPFPSYCVGCGEVDGYCTCSAVADKFEDCSKS